MSRPGAAASFGGDLVASYPAALTKKIADVRRSSSTRISRRLMSLSAGTRLGSYEIISALGAGGMGEVYRATDTKLKRQVAVKILPPAMAADSDRLARFQREAEVLASLNHPHIAAALRL